jgi:hypothetical protein
MFYRDGKGQTDPYTWAEFMDHLARRIRAENQPALVRAKYGVGFDLNGGDLEGRAFDPEKVSEPAEFRHLNGQPVLVPEAMVMGPLSGNEITRYRQRLAALVSQGDDEPLDDLPPESLSALHHLGFLPPEVEHTSTSHPEVRKALNAFRDKVGKAEPDDPAHADLLLPAERIALEAYDRRIRHYGGIQACQRASFEGAPDLNGFKTLPAGPRRAAAPHVATVQTALLEQGLLKQPVKKSVWRDKKRRKRVSYKTLPFAGQPDKATIAALDSFQLRSGLIRTGGVLDAVTLELLGLPAMGPEIFLPLSGPVCALDAAEVGPADLCPVATRDRWTPFGALRQQGPELLASLAAQILRQGPDGSDPAPKVSDDPDCAEAPQGQANGSEGAPASS